MDQLYTRKASDTIPFVILLTIKQSGNKVLPSPLLMEHSSSHIRDAPNPGPQYFCYYILCCCSLSVCIFFFVALLLLFGIGALKVLSVNTIMINGRLGCLGNPISDKITVHFKIYFT